MRESDDLTLTVGDQPRVDNGHPPMPLRERPTKHADRALPVAASPPLAASESVVAFEVQGELAAVESEWRDFEARADCTVFQSFDWVAAWQQHIGAPRGTVPVI